MSTPRSSTLQRVLGLDACKGEHHGTALTREGKRVFDKRLPNSEPKMRAMLDKPTASRPPPGGLHHINSRLFFELTI